MKAVILTSTTDPKVKAGVETYSEQLKKVFPEAKIIGVEQAGKSFAENFSPLREPLRARGVAEYVKRNLSALQPELIITNGMYGWAINEKESGCRIINVSHGTFAGLAESALKKNSLEYYRTRYVYSFFEKKSAQNASAVVSNSKQTQELNMEYYKVNSQVIYNFVDTEIFKQVEKGKAREELGLRSGKRIGLFVGRQEYQKGFDIVENVAKSLKNIEILSVTFPKTKTEIQNIKAAGPVERELLSTYYSAADFVLFPSRFEGFGFVPIESLACNTPVISSNTGITREIEVEGLHKVGSFKAEDYVQKINTVLDSEEKINSRKFVAQRFSADIFRKKFLGLAKG